MTPQKIETQRRQFGRRQTNTRATAAIPGGACVSCDISNVSEGGALIVFATTAVPARPFRLMIDNTDLELLCEPRHQNGTNVGVRFLSSKDGAVLMRHLYPEPVLSQSTWRPEPVPHTKSALNLRDLRDRLMAAWIAAQDRQTEDSLRPTQSEASNRFQKGLFGVTRQLATAGAAMTRIGLKRAMPPSRDRAHHETRPASH